MTKASVFKKTRIAPTPSGFLHLGNVFSFGLTAALAKKTGAAILLRIDDLDRERADLRYVQDIFETLAFLNIPWHEGPSDLREHEATGSQLHRLGLYKKALQRLREENKVYACNCSRTQTGPGGYSGACRHKNLSLDAPDVCWRLDTSALLDLHIKTYGGESISSTLPIVMQDFVVRKKNGYPAYQLCSVIDDVHFGIDLVIRGLDLWDSTLAQLYLARVCGLQAFTDVTFCHHPLLMSPENKKLSKSAGDTSVHFLRGQQNRPEDIYERIGIMLKNKPHLKSWEGLVF